MKMAAAPLPQNINTRRKREKRKRKKKKRRRRKRGRVNNPNLMTSQNLTDSRHLLHAYWPLYLWTARKNPNNEQENTRKSFIKLGTYMRMHTASYIGILFCPSAVRKKLHQTISLCCKTHAESQPAWSGGASALLPMTSSRKWQPPRDHWQTCSISRLSVEASLLHEVILLYTKPHCNRTAVCTMQSTQSSLTVLIMSRLYCIFFFAYMLKFCVHILLLAAKEIKSTEGEKW